MRRFLGLLILCAASLPASNWYVGTSLTNATPDGAPDHRVVWPGDMCPSLATGDHAWFDLSAPPITTGIAGWIADGTAIGKISCVVNLPGASIQMRGYVPSGQTAIIGYARVCFIDPLKHSGGPAVPGAQGLFSFILDTLDFERMEACGVGWLGLANAPSAAGLFVSDGVTSIHVKDCYFHDNYQGVAVPLTYPNPLNLLWEGNVFDQNGYLDGAEHEFYVGEAHSITMIGNLFRSSVAGHLAKSKAGQYFTYLGNIFLDDYDGKYAGTSNAYMAYPPTTQAYGQEDARRAGSKLLDVPYGGSGIIAQNDMWRGPGYPLQSSVPVAVSAITSANPGVFTVPTLNVSTPEVVVSCGGTCNTTCSTCTGPWAAINGRYNATYIDGSHVSLATPITGLRTTSTPLDTSGIAQPVVGNVKIGGRIPSTNWAGTATGTAASNVASECTSGDGFMQFGRHIGEGGWLTANINSSQTTFTIDSTVNFPAAPFTALLISQSYQANQFSCKTIGCTGSLTVAAAGTDFPAPPFDLRIYRGIVHVTSVSGSIFTGTLDMSLAPPPAQAKNYPAKLVEESSEQVTVSSYPANCTSACTVTVSARGANGTTALPHYARSWAGGHLGDYLNPGVMQSIPLSGTDGSFDAATAGKNAVFLSAGHSFTWAEAGSYLDISGGSCSGTALNGSRWYMAYASGGNAAVERGLGATVGTGHGCTGLTWAAEGSVWQPYAAQDLRYNSNSIAMAFADWPTPANGNRQGVVEWGPDSSNGNPSACGGGPVTPTIGIANFTNNLYYGSQYALGTALSGGNFSYVGPVQTFSGAINIQATPSVNGWFYSTTRGSSATDGNAGTWWYRPPLSNLNSSGGYGILTPDVNSGYDFHLRPGDSHLGSIAGQGADLTTSTYKIPCGLSSGSPPETLDLCGERGRYVAKSATVTSYEPRFPATVITRSDLASSNPDLGAHRYDGSYSYSTSAVTISGTAALQWGATGNLNICLAAGAAAADTKIVFASSDETSLLRPWATLIPTGQSCMNVPLTALPGSGVQTVTVTAYAASTAMAGSGSTVVTVAGSPTPPSITTASLPGGTVGVSYNQTLAATGGTSPYRWSVTSGALPAGVTLTSGSGNLNGVPSAAAIYNFSITAVDAIGSASSPVAYSVQIQAPAAAVAKQSAAGKTGLRKTQIH